MKASSGSPTSAGCKSSWSPRPDDPAPILYFSGCREWPKGVGEKDLHRDGGWRFRCFSYFYLEPEKDAKTINAWDYCLRQPDIRLFLDSGAHTFLAKTKGKLTDKALGEYLDQYAIWASPLQDRMDFVVNFDYIKHAPTIYEVLRGLTKRGLRVIPCYHGDSSLDWIRRYADEGYRLIGLGKPVSFVAGGKWLRHNYYDPVFALTEKLGIKCHGFAVTGSNLFHFPWYSVDSASWLRIAVRGAVLLYDPGRRKLEVHHVAQDAHSSTTREGIHSLSKSAKAAIHERLIQYGVPIAKLQKSSYWRAVHNIRAQVSAMQVKPPAPLGMRGWSSVL